MLWQRDMEIGATGEHRVMSLLVFSQIFLSTQMKYIPVNLIQKKVVALKNVVLSELGELNVVDYTLQGD